MILKPKSNIGLRVVMLARLNNLRAVLLQRSCRFCRWTNHRYVTRHMPIGILIQNQDEASLVSQPLRRSSVRDLAPSRV